MAANVSPLHRVTNARLVALKTHFGTTVSQFGPDAISVMRLDVVGLREHWTFSVVDEKGSPLNAVYVRRGKAANQEKDWVVDYRTGKTAIERVARGKVVELGDFASLDAALSAALLLVVEIER